MLIWGPDDAASEIATNQRSFDSRLTPPASKLTGSEVFLNILTVRVVIIPEEFDRL